MSRLRNRIVKAEFWTDPELARWPRDKRYFYKSLWAMAEDSGCLEDDPLDWKMTAWPSPTDEDMTPARFKAWRGELVRAGKLIPYKAKGKRYLFVVHFHDHEHPRNPQCPNLPLPSWATWTLNPSDQRKGSYSIDDALYKARTSVVHGSPALPCPVLSGPVLSGTEQNRTGLPIGSDSDAPPDLTLTGSVGADGWTQEQFENAAQHATEAKLEALRMKARKEAS